MLIMKNQDKAIHDRWHPKKPLDIPRAKTSDQVFTTSPFTWLKTRRHSRAGLDSQATPWEGKLVWMFTLVRCYSTLEPCTLWKSTAYIYTHILISLLHILQHALTMSLIAHNSMIPSLCALSLLIIICICTLYSTCNVWTFVCCNFVLRSPYCINWICSFIMGHHLYVHHFVSSNA